MTARAEIEGQWPGNKPAQGTALGTGLRNDEPCRGDTKFHRGICPAPTGLGAYWGVLLRAMPWAGMGRTFGVQRPNSE